MNNSFKLIFSIAIAFLTAFTGNGQNNFEPGATWPASDGNHINVHGGGILFYHGRYYWFGEHRLPKNNEKVQSDGVGCYSSKDLYHWKYEGVSLRIPDDTTSLLTPGCLVERPKVIYNRKTKKFVMWFHHELKGQGYKAAMTGLAVSDKITGPYRYIHSLRPNAGQWPLNYSREQQADTVTERSLKKWSPEWKKAVKDGLFLRRDFEGGQMARDMTLYVDDNGKAYHIHSSEENQTLHFSELTDDYLGFSGRYIRVLPGDANEAPAIFKKDGKYYMFASGTTGWAPNPGRSAMSSEILGNWTPLGNPCRGNEKDVKTTFASQSTHVLQINGTENFIYMGDRWKPEELIDSRHVWLPVEWENGLPVIRWYDKWDVSIFNHEK